MLTVPTKGFDRSVQVHNVRLDVLSDWIEGSVLFYDEELSLADIADVLVEEKIYDEQGYAYVGVKDAWTELQRRCLWIGDGYAFTIDNSWIRPRAEWKDVPAHSFCTLLSIAPFYDWWTEEFGQDYTVQGELFELLTKESIEAQFEDWNTYQTGWSRTNKSGFNHIVDEVASRLGEIKGRLELWENPNAKELGLDLLWYRPFRDNRIGITVYLIQCASGRNWKSKLKTPDLEIWRNVIQFTTLPKRAFSTPFSFLDKQFTQNCVIIDGLLLDRSRLLAASRYDENWVSQSLKDRIIAWAEPRIKVLLNKSK